MHFVYIYGKIVAFKTRFLKGIPMDTTKPFRYVAEIAHCQSISLAAKKLHLRQPALSRYLKTVEADLGVELFDRTASPLCLTDAGRVYLDTAGKIIVLDDQLRRNLARLTDNAIISVGIGPSRATYLLPPILQAFSQKLPNATVNIVEGTVDELSRMLDRGELDLAINLLHSGSTRVQYTPLYNESIFLAVPEQSPLRTFDEAVRRLPLISPPKGQLLSEAQNLLPLFTSHIECRNSATALSLVASGLGATLIPSYVSFGPVGPDIRLLPLPPETAAKLRRKICIFYRSAQSLNPTEKEFIRCCIQTLKNDKENPYAD